MHAAMSRQAPFLAACVAELRVGHLMSSPEHEQMR